MKFYTIRDIARMADVSVSTVSRVLNHRPDVNAETRARVETVMAACHFVGNANARGLKQTEPEDVAIIVRGRQNPFLSGLAEALQEHAALMGLPCLTDFLDEKGDEFQEALTLAQQRRVAGLIFVGSRIDERCTPLVNMPLPMVFATVSTEGTPLSHASSVSIDDRKLAHEAVTTLLRRGLHRIAVFGGSQVGRDSPALRAQGVADAFRGMGMVFDPERYVETRFTLADAYQAALAFFREHRDTQAVFCMSDNAAVGVLRALHDLDLRVPEDVSVIGVDGMEIGEYLVPRLSTVVQPVQELARVTVEELARLMKGGASAVPEHITVPARLVLRESVLNPNDQLS